MPSDPDRTSAPVSSTAPPPPVEGVTVEELSAVGPEDVQGSASASSASDGVIGTTIATLGNATDPGFWMETPLVATVREGRIKSNVTGRTVKVTLRPIPGPAGAGSRISLSALQLLDLPLDGLHKLEVSGL
ncbi:hypothetical protein O2N63_08160 [Aliiroseovarius sp. KMU-50]|uniref:D-galactarate dehydratase n=1 Tax=Aliiroseovarius salicola TaxID=3009082 RepID=A0ABT4W0P9_9RHOB|nr:hypothetical protein [Aliiroseovarius sp. KMU-50]MDA5094062.1 hypothetical protein [Aliiroseovarius sp. KMU-50]